MPLTAAPSLYDSMPMSSSREIDARGVDRVQRREHEVARERRLDRDARRFAVADFADEHDVGVLTQDRAKGRGEREPRLLVHLHLDDAVSLYSTGSSTVTMFTPRVWMALERRIERRRLAGSRRAGDEHDALAEVDQVLDARRGRRARRPSQRASRTWRRHRGCG